jgi:capsular polysaccharide biosynthesis protein
MQRSHDFAMQKFWQESFNERPEAFSVLILRSAESPDNPSLPNLRINIPLSLLIGLLLGVGAAIAVEAIDRRIRSESDVTELLALPVLSTIVL